MTRLQAMKHIRRGKNLETLHEGIDSTFKVNLTPSMCMSGKVSCLFINVRTWGGMYGCIITPRELLSYIKRNFPR